MKKNYFYIFIIVILSFFTGFFSKFYFEKRKNEKKYYEKANISNLSKSLNMDKRCLKPIIEDGDIVEIKEVIDDFLINKKNEEDLNL